MKDGDDAYETSIDRGELSSRLIEIVIRHNLGHAELAYAKYELFDRGTRKGVVERAFAALEADFARSLVGYLK